jgi:hypothetical protein
MVDCDEDLQGNLCDAQDIVTICHSLVCVDSCRTFTPLCRLFSPSLEAGYRSGENLCER